MKKKPNQFILDVKERLIAKRSSIHEEPVGDKIVIDRPCGRVPFDIVADTIRGDRVIYEIKFHQVDRFQIVKFEDMQFMSADDLVRVVMNFENYLLFM